MNNLKKLVAVLLVAVMAVACFAVSAGAADKSVTVNVGDVEVAYDEAKLAKLADGNTASDATEFGNEGLVSFENKGFTHGVDAAVEATFEIVLDLGEVQTIGSIALDCFKDTNSFVDLPTGVKFYASVDGETYYDVNAGGTVAPAADAAEYAMATLKADFSTRIALNARYVKAVVTYKNGWVFASELSVGAAAEGVTAETPDKAYAYTESSCPNPGIGVFTAADGELDLSLNADGKLFLNSQLIKAVYDEAVDAYKISYSKLNPWPDGHSGTETLAEGEILVAVVTGGVVTADEFSGAKWIARGLVEGDYIVLNDDSTLNFVPASAMADQGGDEESSDEATSSEEETSSEEAASSEEATSSEAVASSEPVEAGDSGVIVFAVLGILAVVGVAVVAKVRN